MDPLRSRAILRTMAKLETAMLECGDGGALEMTGDAIQYFELAKELLPLVSKRRADALLLAERSSQLILGPVMDQNGPDTSRLFLAALSFYGMCGKEAMYWNLFEIMERRHIFPDSGADRFWTVYS